ncbi:MAG: membrane protein insertase YidC [Hirschia sp.]|nr:membrane protein insertase YidC [Hirschia sp.]MBF17336.1 membrane protein insertase YidC [Hirschia sp.]
MEKNDQQNFMLAIGLILVIMLASQYFLWGPNEKARLAEIERQETALSETTPAIEAPALPRDRNDVLKDEATEGARISFDAPAVDGSISVKGARIDDLSLKRHFTTVDKEEEVHLLTPRGAQNAFYAFQGWSGEANDLPNANTLWKQIGTGKLTPTQPVTLTYANGELTFERVIAIDDNYMFTITDKVTNTSGTEVVIRPYGAVRQHGLPDGWKPFHILHEGAIGMAGTKLKQQKYKNLDKGQELSFTSTGGWIGLTTKYWMATLIPDQAEPIAAKALVHRDGLRTIYETRVEGANREVRSGQTISYTSRIFAGAKRVEVLDAYQKNGATGPLGEELQPIPRFTDAVDWGHFWFFTKPFFWLLSQFNDWFGNFGLAIMALTVIVKLAFFPIQNTAYASMAKMRKLMPEMEKIKERFGADKQRQQQEIMALYQREKANPFAGCLPLIPQMFVFYGLYKTLFVTLEMRHEPFLYLNDLSAPDPSSLLNLFGLIPWEPASIPLIGPIIGIGLLPVMYGLTMWCLQNLSPPPPDPTQKMMMQFLPLVFTFIFAGFAAGLVLYWTWSNILSIAQQYYIMRKNGVETQLDTWLKKKLGGEKTEVS